MRIEKIYIAGFGGLKDFALDLSDGLNVIYGENENGKTTVMNFIKAMFYGTGNKVKDLSKSVREKYRPWDDGIMAGRIFFEDGGRKYCLQREFKKTDSTDKISLTDTDTGENLPVSSDIGNKLFGIGVESFERSMFIGNIGYQSISADANGEINAKLSSLATTCDEDTSFELVEGNLTNARKKFTAKGKNAGLYSVDSEKLSELKAKLKASNEAAERYSFLCNEIKDLSVKAEEISVILENKKQVIDSENNSKLSAKLKEYIEFCDMYDKATENLKFKSGTVVTPEFLNAARFGISSIEKCNQRIDLIKSDIARLEEKAALFDEQNIQKSKAEAEAVTARIAEAEKEIASLKENLASETERLEDLSKTAENSANKKKAVNPILLIVGILFVVLGIGLFGAEIGNIVSFAAMGAGAIAAVLSFILRPTDKSYIQKLENDKKSTADKINVLQNRISATESKMFSEQTKLSVLSSALNSDESIKKQCFEELEAKQKQFSAEDGKRSAEMLKLTDYFKKYGEIDDFSAICDTVNRLASGLEEIKPLRSKLSYLKEDLGEIDRASAEEKLNSIENGINNADIDFDDLKQEYEELRKEETELNSVLAAKKAELKSEFKAYENPESIKKSIKALEETIESEENFLGAIDIASEVLLDSFAELRRSYGSLLDKKATEIFSKLTGGKYDRMEVSKGFEIKVANKDDFSSHEVEYLSSGTLDQAYLSLKLAVSSFLSDKKSLPVFLDDCLSQYDDARMNTALEFLKEYAANSQMIFFTCHKATEESAQKIGVNITPIKK